MIKSVLGSVVGGQGPPLPRLPRRDDHRGQVTQRPGLRQPQRVVLTGLAFGPFELPGLAGGVGDRAGQAASAAQVMDSACQGAGLDDDRTGRCRSIRRGTSAPLVVTVSKDAWALPRSQAQATLLFLPRSMARMGLSPAGGEVVAFMVASPCGGVGPALLAAPESDGDRRGP